MNISKSLRFQLLLIYSILMVSCGNKKPAAAVNAQAQPEYPVLLVSQHSVTLYSDFPATIEGMQNVEIRPRIDGYIDKIYVDEGSTVLKGQLLFRISAPLFEQAVRTASADIKIAEADVKAAQMQVAKVRPLVEKNIISKYELESAEYSFQSRQAALAQAHARLANARTNLGYASVTSPVNGVVGEIPLKIGSLVSSTTQQPLTTVSNIGNIHAYFSVNEKQSLDFTRNTKGANIQQRLATLPPVTLVLADGVEFPQKGKIETASGLINTETGSVRVRASFPNPGNFLRSGSSGMVRLPRQVDSALIIPQKATYEIQGKKFVYLLADSGSVKSVEISVMGGENGQYFVVEEGLEPGNRIILEGVASLREGMSIKPRVTNADSVYQKMLEQKKL